MENNNKLKDNKYVQIFSYVFMAIIFSALAWAFISGYILKKTGIIIDGEITGYGHGSMSETISIRYSYSYNNRTYSHIRGMNGIYYNNGDKFVNKHFPVLYSKQINKGTLLLTPFDFEKYNIPFPDSLKWIFKYYPNK